MAPIGVLKTSNVKLNRPKKYNVSLKIFLHAVIISKTHCAKFKIKTLNFYAGTVKKNLI